MKVQGGPELRRRIKAIQTSFKDVGKRWGNRARDEMRHDVPMRTGRLRRSFRVRASGRRARVLGHFTAYFVDAGTQAHMIRPRKAQRLAWAEGGRPVFARRVNHPGVRKRPFRAKAARIALRETAGAEQFIKAWNDAA